MRQCDMKLCASFHASITVPEGWVEDKEASRELGVQMLLPKGQAFDAAPAKIYALVRYNKDKQPVSAITRIPIAIGARARRKPRLQNLQTSRVTAASRLSSCTNSKRRS
jgi:hypothetical protein